MIKKFLFLILFIYCVSCANPTIVNFIGPNDNNLSCEELSNEITLANKYADEAKEAKKMDKPHNIGAILFFLPGFQTSACISNLHSFSEKRCSLPLGAIILSVKK